MAAELVPDRIALYVPSGQQCGQVPGRSWPEARLAYLQDRAREDLSRTDVSIPGITTRVITC